MSIVETPHEPAAAAGATPGPPAGGRPPGTLPDTVASPVQRRAQGWIPLLAIYSVTAFVESLGVSQVFAFMPQYLLHMGVPDAEIGQTVGVLSSLVFVLGLPLVPLWGVWADKYSRKAVIIRSAIVEAIVFAAVALSRTPWQLGASLLLVGFQLGNTGVMLAAIRDSAPRRRLGTAIALFGASSPIGFAVGPALGGVMIDGLHLPISSVYAFAAVLSVAVAVLLALGSREVRPEVVPTGSVRSLAFGAVRGVLTDRATMGLFGIFGLAFLARQLANPFLPLLVRQLNGDVGLASAIALVVGTAALAGALVSPLTGAFGDRIGFRPVLLASLCGGAVALLAMPVAPSVPALAGLVVVFAACSAGVSAMVFGLLAMELPPERRSATLNLVYLPLYVSGIAGPALGAAIVGAGLGTVFVLGGVLMTLAGVLVASVLIHGARAHRLA